MILQQDAGVPPHDLVLEHRHLCRRGAQRFLRAGLERADLEQVAAIGLVKASRRYDAARATPFEAYAWFGILGELAHHVRAHEHLVRFPRRLRALERRYTETWERLAADFHREPSDAELARDLRFDWMTVAQLRHVREVTQLVSLDDPTSEAEADVALGSNAERLALEDRLDLKDGLRTLTLLERRIVIGIYWLGLSRFELGRRLGVSAHKVACAHRCALARLRRRLSSAA